MTFQKTGYLSKISNWALSKPDLAFAGPKETDGNPFWPRSGLAPNDADCRQGAQTAARRAVERERGRLLQRPPRGGQTHREVGTLGNGKRPLETKKGRCLRHQGGRFQQGPFLRLFQGAAFRLLPLVDQRRRLDPKRAFETVFEEPTRRRRARRPLSKRPFKRQNAVASPFAMPRSWRPLRLASDRRRRQESPESRASKMRRKRPCSETMLPRETALGDRAFDAIPYFADRIQGEPFHSRRHRVFPRRRHAA
mmetsp:Transcript_11068/g.39098  ORF Transcript_11068/g.39098 Transcript_11068/m.39098 type:complete len:252 (-) Transcript_11068:1345-2100(-)